MGGDGTIGGGSCYVEFTVKGKPEKREDDDHAKEGDIITVSFPGTPGQPDVKVPLRKGPCVKFHWD